MTEMDLRIAFKMDTGYYPLWAKNHNGKPIGGWDFSSAPTFTFIKGVPTSLYGRWLEDKTGKRSRYLRDLYFRKTGETPTWYYHNPGREIDGGPLIRDYIFWLESFILRFRPEVVKEILHLD